MEIAAWHWSPGGGKENFGDVLGVEVLRRLGYEVRVVPLTSAEVVACGSVGQMMGKAQDGCVAWGTGTMMPKARLPRQVDWRAVRGPRTAAMVRGGQPHLGDTALLVPRLWPRPSTRRGAGLVRHYVDHRRYDVDRQIDCFQPVDEVIRFIGESSRIVTSSLHGLIVAQAYGIPATRMPHPQVVGGDHKWDDHAGALEGKAVDELADGLLAVRP